MLGKKLDEKLKPTQKLLQTLDGKADRAAVSVANLVEDLHQVPATLKAIRQTLERHTGALDQFVDTAEDQG